MLAAERRGVQDRPLRPVEGDRRTAPLGSHLPAPEPAAPGNAERNRLGEYFLADAEADHPLLADRPQTAAEIDVAALGALREPPDLPRRPAAERHLMARDALREGAEGQTAQAGLQLAQRLRPDGNHPGAGARLLESLGDDPVEHLRLLGKLVPRLGDVLLRGGVDLAHRGEDLVADPVAREAAVQVGRVIGERKPRLGGQPAHLGAVDRQQRANEPPAPRGKPEQGAPAR